MNELEHLTQEQIDRIGYLKTKGVHISFYENLEGNPRYIAKKNTPAGREMRLICVSFVGLLENLKHI